MMEKQERPNLSVSAVGLVQLRIKDHNTVVAAKSARDNLRILMDKSCFLKNTPFTWISFVYLYGEENKFIKPELGRFSKKYGDLPVTVEIASDWIEYASFNDEAMLEQIFESTALMALIYVGKKYKLPTEALEERLKEIGGFPELPEGYYEKLPPNAYRAPKNQLPQFQDK